MGQEPARHGEATWSGAQHGLDIGLGAQQLLRRGLAEVQDGAGPDQQDQAERQESHGGCQGGEPIAGTRGRRRPRRGPKEQQAAGARQGDHGQQPRGQNQTQHPGPGGIREGGADHQQLADETGQRRQPGDHDRRDEEECPDQQRPGGCSGPGSGDPTSSPRPWAMTSASRKKRRRRKGAVGQVVEPGADPAPQSRARRQ